MDRYQPGSLGAHRPSEKPEAPMTPGDSSDELDTLPAKERFSLRLLLEPDSETPTKTSGLIVYVATAAVCESDPKPGNRMRQ